jgi:hypothetical protein
MRHPDGNELLLLSRRPFRELLLIPATDIVTKSSREAQRRWEKYERREGQGQMNKQQQHSSAAPKLKRAAEFSLSLSLSLSIYIYIYIYMSHTRRC